MAQFSRRSWLRLAVAGLPLWTMPRAGSAQQIRRPAVVSRTELSDHVYERDTDRDFNSIEVIVSRLRRKIAPCQIETVRGEGYRLDAGHGD